MSLLNSRWQVDFRCQQDFRPVVQPEWFEYEPHSGAVFNAITVAFYRGSDLENTNLRNKEFLRENH